MRGLIAALASIGTVASFAPQAAEARLTPRTRRADRALASAMWQGLNAAGGADGVLVVDLSTGRTLFGAAARTPRLPASVEKIYTTSTALMRFGHRARLSTTVFGRGWVGRYGAWHGTLYLRGGGDPTFGSAAFDQYAYGTGATIEQLVANLRRAGITGIYGHIVGDASYFDSAPGTSESNYQFDPYVEGSLSALAFNRGLINQGSSYVLDPPSYAAQQLQSTMLSAGMRVSGSTTISAGVTPAGARPLATVTSPPMATLLHLTNTPSDNFFAEMLLKGIGARFGSAGTSAAGAAVVRAQMVSSFGIHPRLVDGSGLSRADHTSPLQVVTLLRRMATKSTFVNSLAVAGVSGTLQYEMQGTIAQGRCRGKTGTLHDVANLAGYCTALDGHRLAFAFLFNSIGDPTYVHQTVEANMAVAVASYNG